MEILNDSVKSFEKLYLQLQDGFPDKVRIIV